MAKGITISGTVRDSANGEVLIGAAVYSGEYGTTTNVDGSFLLMLVSDAKEFQVSYVGYETQTIPIGTQRKFDVLLVESSRFLNPVIVSAGKQEQKETETTVSIATIQPYLIQNRITTNIKNTLNQIPGLTNTDGQANIRSGSGWSYGTGSRVSVLVDDMPMLASGTGQANWSFFPIENIRQVEVIKGSSSVLYGSSALNGVINIRTDWPGNKELISASLYAGVYGAPPKASWKWKPESETFLTKSGGHFLYGNGTDRFQYVVSLNGLLDEGYRMGDQDKRIRFSGKTRFFSKDKRWVYGLNTNVLYGRTGTFLLWESYDMAYTSLDSSYGLNSSQRINLDPYIQYHGKNADHFFQTRWYNVINAIDSVEGEPNQTNRTQSFYSEYRLKWKRWSEKGLMVNLGLVNLYGESQATMFQGNKVQQNHAAYLQADYKKGRWNLSAGARYEYYRLENYNEAKPVFKAGVNYKAGKATWLRGSFGQGYRFPVVSEAFIRTSAGPVTIFPNEALKSESGYTAELGIRQGFETKKGFKLMADLAFYRMYFENMMEFTFAQWGTINDPLNGIGFKSVNIGKSVIQGFEISLMGETEVGGHHFRYFGGYTFSDAINLEPDLVYASANGFPQTYKSTSSDTTGTKLKYRNRHLIKFDFQWEYKRFGTGISYRYASQYEAIDNAFQSLPIDIFVPGVKASMEANAKGYHVVDLRFFYKITSDWKISMALNNVFNTEIITRPCDAGAPRNLNFQLSYKY